MIRLFELFAGYGGASFSLKKAGVDFKCVGYSEIDKFAIQCYNQNFPNIKNYGDVTKINPIDLPDFDLLTGGFPCQDVSIAGKRDLTKGRTNLYKEILGIAEAKKPKYMLLENVKGLLSINKDRNLRDIIINDLRKIGYDVCFKLLNSKDFGTPQNRERVWFVCKYGKWNFNEFKFPTEKPLNLFLKDILETNVDNKYYLTDKKIEFLKRNQCKYPNRENYAKTISSGFYKQGKQESHNLIQVNRSIMIGNLSRYKMKHFRSIYNKNKGVSWCVDTKNNNGVSEDGTNIRKFTPKECFRLMGFFNDEINLDGLSDTQKYKLAGNGWDINLVSQIFKNIFN